MQYPDLVDVNPSLNLNTPELQVKLDRQRAADIGVRMTDISDAVRLFYSGEDEITRFKEGSEQYPVTMQLLPEQRDNPDVLTAMMVPVQQTRTGAPGKRRDHCSRLRIRRLCGATTANFRSASMPTSPPAIRWIWPPRTPSVRSRKLDCRAGYSYRFSGQVKVLEETTWNLLLAMLLASIFMYMVLAAQFESFSYPFIIMLTLPLSVPFALFSLWITGRALSLWSALGMFLLLGIVKKNGILQVDYTNRLRGRGHCRYGGHPGSQPRTAAPNPDDHTLDHRGVDSGCHRDRGRLGTARLDRRDHHRRPDSLPAADLAGGTGWLLVSGRVTGGAVAQASSPRHRTYTWH